MAQNVIINGVTYQNVPEVDIPKSGGGTAAFFDVTDTTAAAADVASGKYFHAADGTLTEGTSSGGGTGGGSILPAGYTQLDYVILSGTQYALIDYTPVQHDRIDCTFMKTDNFGCLFSAGTGTYQWILLNNIYYKYLASGNAPQFTPTLSVGQIYQLTADSTATASSPPLTTSVANSPYEGALGSSEKLHLGNRANNTSYFQGYIFEFILSNSGMRKIHLVPCKQDSTGYVGFYDLIAGTFIKSNGSDEFIAGPESLTPEEIVGILLGGDE